MRHTAGHLPQNGIAREMALDVVDFLAVIEVHREVYEDDCEAGPGRVARMLRPKLFRRPRLTRPVNFIVGISRNRKLFARSAERLFQVGVVFTARIDRSSPARIIRMANGPCICRRVRRSTFPPSHTPNLIISAPK